MLLALTSALVIVGVACVVVTEVEDASGFELFRNFSFSFVADQQEIQCLPSGFPKVLSYQICQIFSNIRLLSISRKFMENTPTSGGVGVEKIYKIVFTCEIFLTGNEPSEVL